jgi:hypothetical protein
MMFVSVTRLHLISPFYLPAFLWNTLLSSLQLINTPGFKGGKILRDAKQTFWTMTAWEEQAAMKIYRNEGAHRKVMPKIQEWCDEAWVVHWQQEDSNLPSWGEVHQRMLTEGYPTKLSQPSPAHIQRYIPEPLSSKGLILRPRKRSSHK